MRTFANILLAGLSAMTLLALSSCRNGGSIVYVESFRKKGISDDRIISNAIAAAGESGMVFFAPGRTYLITNAILVKKFQVLVGNNSTLLRANQTFTRLMSAAGDTDRDLRLEHIPEGWQIGDQLQVLLDSTGGHCTAFGDLPRLPQIIEKIEGTTVHLSSVVGPSVDGTIRTWPAGAYVRKVYTLLRGDSINNESVPFTVRNINFDGNKKNNDLNYYWNVNSTIFTRGAGAKIEDCRFFDIPNENIVGQGIYISNCQAYRLNGSFIHLSGIDTFYRWPQKQSYISGNYVDGVCEIPNAVTRHSEGAITTSYNGGFATIMGNRIYNSGEAALGLINAHVDIADAGVSDLIVMGNLFENCRRILYDVYPVYPGTHPARNISIIDNIFANCGVNDWSGYTFLSLYPGLHISNNSLTDGTKWVMPHYRPG